MSDHKQPSIIAALLERARAEGHEIATDEEIAARRSQRAEASRQAAAEPTPEEDGAVRTLRHVQRSQVWPGSRGGAVTLVHAHVAGTFVAISGRKTTIHRSRHQSLCGRTPWYENDPAGGEPRCEECERLAVRYGIDWP